MYFLQLLSVVLPTSTVIGPIIVPALKAMFKTQRSYKFGVPYNLKDHSNTVSGAARSCILQTLLASKVDLILCLNIPLQICRTQINTPESEHRGQCTAAYQSRKRKFPQKHNT